MNDAGTKLCIMSLICMFIVPIIVFIIGASFMSGDISGATADAYSVIIKLDILSCIVAWGLAIYSRMTYMNRFSLVLLIIYGSLLALFVIGIIVFICIVMGLF